MSNAGAICVKHMKELKTVQGALYNFTCIPVHESLCRLCKPELDPLYQIVNALQAEVEKRKKPKEVHNANELTNCYKCIHKRGVSGSCHSSCVKPDPQMTGNEHGIKSGWFFYPINFDPIWKTKECSNFEAKEKKEK